MDSEFQWELVRLRASCFVALFFCTILVPAQTAPVPPTLDQIQTVELQGTVQVAVAGTTNWIAAHVGQTLNPADHLRTGANSRVALRWSNQSVITFGALTELEILPPPKTDSQSGLHLVRGILSFFHRDQPGRIQIITRGAVAGVEGTEFVLAVDEAERSTLAVVDGKVRLGNEQGTLVLTNSEQAVVELGRAPMRTAGFIANNLLQWCFYYPAVLDLKDLALTDESQARLAKSLTAYRSGDLLAALAEYPTNQPLTSDSERLYRAALLLSVGQVTPCEDVLANLSETNSASQSQRLAGALRKLIAAVKRETVTSPAPQTATEYLADSYYEQSRAVREKSLKAALNSARQAVSNSPNFGFAWERVAELEFCFGRTKAALSALDKSLALSPRNPQALALKGFILSAENQPREAITWFDRAIAVDAALGNAWLGRGLARIRIRDTKGGREDLLTAAALEPQRAELRSYLGKAYTAAGDDAHATKELDLAKKLDPKDPTAWLYSALQKQQGNQINDAIRDLETSQSLNDNRSVYRSQLLLDQDQAVRAADLASIYADAGMTDVARQEAGRAVSYDYANYSAHLFLGNSYDQLRDPNWSNLRYETPAVSEYTIANLLAPGSAGVLSPLTAQQPYTKLFDQNRVGVVSDTMYLSRGSWYQSGAQFGTYGNFSYSLEANYTSDNGQRVNDDNEHRFLSLTVKDQFTSQDTALFSVQQTKISSGDVSQHYDPANASQSFRVNETQQPNFYLGYHHEWGPGSHTLFYASRQVAYESVFQTNVLEEIGAVFHHGEPFVGNLPMTVDYYKAKVDPTLNSVELQQILEQPDHTTIVGTRFQWGEDHYQNFEWGFNSLEANTYFMTYPVVADQDFTEIFHHYTVYGYHTWQIADPFSVTVGMDYDWLHKPANVGTIPFTEQGQSICQWSPKAGFIWQPLDKTTLRGAYTHQLSGMANGQSTRIEPTEVAGFNQAYRSLAPESVVGDSSGSKFDTFDLSLEQKFDTGTYLSVAGQLLYSELNNVEGNFVFYLDEVYDPYQPLPDGFRKSQNFHEQSLIVTADQMLGKQWSAGMVYHLSRAKLDVNYVDFNPANMGSDLTPPFRPYRSVTSVMNTINLHANWNHPCGLFSIFSADWVNQDNFGFTPSEPGNDFWQFNAYAGYRMFKRRVEFTVGLLNIFDQDYKLEPLNLHNDTARSRTFLARLRINF